MKCPLLNGRCRRTALGVVLLTPVVWVAFLAVVPTDCARRKIADRISRSIGRKVTLGRLRVGPLGGVSLGDLAIGGPGADDPPWLQVGEASIDVSLRQLLFGQVDPSSVDVKGLHLRVLRRRDGSLEMADIVRPDRSPRAATADPDPDAPCEPTGLEVRVREATVLVIDESNGTNLEVTGVSGRGTFQGCQASITELRGTVNGGTVELAAQVDRTDGLARFEGQVRLRGVALGGGMNALAYLSPVLAGSQNGLDGKLALDLYLRGQGDSGDALKKTLVGRGRLVLDPVALDGSKILVGLANLFDLPPEGRVGDVWADLTVKDGRVATENLTVDVAKVPVVLAGWTDFDGQVDYRLRAEGFLDKLPPKAQDLLNQLRPRLKLDELSGVKIGGSVNSLVITSRGVPITRGDDLRRAQEIGRRVRDQIRR